MQKELKNKILDLKNAGMGYKAIAKELSLTPSAVRNVCTSKLNDPELYGNCKNCGKRVKQTPGKKKRQFCSDKCRMTWWNSHRDDVKRNTFYTFKCPCCNSDFVAYGNKKRIYCSIACFTKYKTKRGNKQ
jgi:endogenous inhibitor of DNA gyrase (YacG/DUF329 family)